MTIAQAGMAGFAPKVLIQPITNRWMTVRDLKSALDGLDPDVWVCVDGKGSAVQVIRELGANEPFVVIKSVKK